jgi:hypothetical protein
MPNSNSLRQAARIAATGSVVVALLGAALTPVADAAASYDLRDSCGYQGWGEYRHCDGGTGSTVMLDVQDIWGNIYHYCVGPGVTDLQPVIRWRVTGAWWNGGVGCAPGYYGPA